MTTETLNPVEIAKTVLSIAMQASVPVYVYAQPGVGKSASIRAIAEARGMAKQLHTIMLAMREPSDQSGLPAVHDGEDGRPNVRIVPPGWARDLMRDGRGIVFFDEVANATPAVMNSALRIIQEGVVGDGETLPASTSFVMAGNPPDTNMGANTLTAGIANRSLHLEWPWSYEAWRTGMLSRWSAGPSAATIATLPADWQDGIPEMVSLIIAFLDTRPALAQAQPSDLDAQGQAWPSGRTWELAATMLAAAKSVGFDPRSAVGRTIVLGLVGAAASIEWSTWVVNMDLPSTAEVLKNPSGFKMPKRQDQVASVLSGVVAYVHQDRSLDTYEAAWVVVGRVLKESASFAIRAAKDLEPLAPPGADANPKSAFVQTTIAVGKELKKAKVDYGRRSA